MFSSRIIAKTLIALVCVSLAVSGLLYATAANPPNGLTGAPGESSCGIGLCHGNLNTGTGGIFFVSSPRYRAGDTLDIDLTVAHSGQQRWGFEMTVLDSLGRPIGTLLATDTIRTQKSVSNNGRQYLKQTFHGTDIGKSDTSFSWTMKWVAPSTPAGIITFYAAGNAANGDSINSGDYIYTKSWQVKPAGCCTGFADNVDCDGQDVVDVADLTALMDHLFISLTDPCCLEEANMDGSLDRIVDISDLTALIDFLFITTNPLPVCNEL
ncbi:MAG: choice-of-anchor V domain-containing protein [candidate division Zixibacteria bacterium]|nr:choice-of-anchor V domain-containing protein [candidate division Zixibacteria bacterium]